MYIASGLLSWVQFYLRSVFDIAVRTDFRCQSSFDFRLVNGENWTVPHILNPPRTDVDKGMGTSIYKYIF